MVKEEIHKVHITLTELAEAELIILKHKTGSKTFTEIIAKSLKMFNFLVKEVQKGNKVLIYNPKTNEYKEIIFNIE